MPKKPLPQRKGVLPGMRKMVVQIPEDLFKALKVHAAQEDTTMKELVEIALRRLLKVPEGGESGKR